ncbi:hypothetical protein CALCODRAFT_512322 [Calocera cornea HHB12733]|uniref:Uncharacterized protein n=1 Tax=Calocera cornea HHB12733 TaxID=1353952 RepID=A0A165D483_9BASI|nr:hypothetical protein CALCODRAFT_512322 [Calocera cornea HHB12733]
MSVLSSIEPDALALVVFRHSEFNDIQVVDTNTSETEEFEYMVALGTGTEQPYWLLAEAEGDHWNVSFQQKDDLRNRNMAVLQLTRPHPQWRQEVETRFRRMQDKAYSGSIISSEGAHVRLNPDDFKNLLLSPEGLAEELIIYLHPSGISNDSVLDEMSRRENAAAFTRSKEPEDENFIRSAFLRAEPPSPQAGLESPAQMILGLGVNVNVSPNYPGL